MSLSLIHIFENTHEAIIDQQTFDLVQKIRVASDIPTDFLHKVKGLLVNDSFMGILENLSIIHIFPRRFRRLRAGLLRERTCRKTP